MQKTELYTGPTRDRAAVRQPPSSSVDPYKKKEPIHGALNKNENKKKKTKQQQQKLPKRATDEANETAKAEARSKCIAWAIRTACMPRL